MDFGPTAFKGDFVHGDSHQPDAASAVGAGVIDTGGIRHRVRGKSLSLVFGIQASMLRKEPPSRLPANCGRTSEAPFSICIPLIGKRLAPNSLAVAVIGSAPHPSNGNHHPNLTF